MLDHIKRDEPLRVSLHSHINGLGSLDNNHNGIVSQKRARKALNLIQKLVQQNNENRVILISGKSGTGKTALAIGFLKDISPVNFTTPSELFGRNLSKTESLTQAIRKSLSVTIKEEIDVLEGEVIDLKDNKVVLKTTDMEGEFSLGRKMQDELSKEKVCIGDIIQIYKDTGKIYKIGKSFVRANEYDALGPDAKFIPCPDGEICKKKVDVNEITLHEMDVLNCNPQGHVKIYSGDMSEIGSEVRDQVNKKVDEWVLEGKAEFKIGVLFIDDVDLLDIECFSFLNKAVEQNFCPTILMATNKECVNVKGTSENNWFGMPKDFLDRLLIIKTDEYNQNELKEIIKIRAKEENICIAEDVVDTLSVISLEYDLRYALNILTISQVKALKENRNVKVLDIQHISKLFINEKKLLDIYN